MAIYMLFLLGWERSLEYFQLRRNGSGVKMNWCQVEGSSNHIFLNSKN